MRSLLALLSLSLPSIAQESPPPVDFAREVRPLLMERCVRCHGERRHEADLRLDRRRFVFRGNPDLWVVTPNAPDDSLLLELVALPRDDPGHMPGEGEPLTTAELDVLRRWIAEGADWPEAIDAAADAAAARRRARETLDVPVLTGDALQAEEDAMARLTELGAQARRIAAATRAIEVDVTRVAAHFCDENVTAMRALAPRLCWLRLRGSQITDASGGQLATFTALRRLDLSGTPITSAGIATIADLPELHTLDLHGTAVDDDAVEALAKLPRLRRVNLWQTRITEHGVARLRAARPELTVELGNGADRAREPRPPD